MDSSFIDYGSNSTNAMIMCIISGLSTAIGGLFILFLKNPSFKLLGNMLGFSSGVMIYISFMDLLPESIEQIGFIPANLFFFAGIIFFALILKFVPDAHEDEEHNHNETHLENNHSNQHVEMNNNVSNDENNHHQANNKNQQQVKQRQKNGADKTPPISPPSKSPAKKKSKQLQQKQQKQHTDSYLKNLGVVTALGISLHNFPEGVAVYLSCLKGIDVGMPLMLAIAAHNIPEGMAVAAPIYSATGSKWQAFKYCLLSGLCEPLGAIIFGLIFREYMTPYLVQAMLAAVAGIMIFMAVKELLPATLKYVDVNSATISNFIGMFVIFLSIYWLHGMLPHDHGDSSDNHHGHSHSGNSHHGHSHGGHDDHHHHHHHQNEFSQQPQSAFH